MSGSRVTHVGDRYNRLTVTEYLYTDDHFRRYFRCTCDCGGSAITHTNSLRTGNTRSCGCLAKELKKARRRPDNYGEISHIILGYKRHARCRDYEWSLSRDTVAELVRRPCFYCGAPPSNIKVTKNTLQPFMYSGLDRVNNVEGYTVANVVPCCIVCNRAKMAMPLSMFAEWARRIGQMAEQWG